MSVRSLLFVPADSERKLAKAADAGADALILDLEDAVAPARKAAARVLARAFLEARRRAVRAQLWVRINALDTREAPLDLQEIIAAQPHGLVVPKVDHPSELVALSDTLSAIEAETGVATGTTRLIALLETARGVLSAADYLQVRLQRLRGLTWGAQDLGAALGLRLPRDPQGEWDFTLRSARAQCLLVARALEVEAIDTVTTDFTDLEALRAEALSARAAGFSGKLALHPDQVDVINGAFLPTAAELERARRIVAAFAAAGGSGAVALDGAMIDIVHLRAARRLLGGEGDLQT